VTSSLSDSGPGLATDLRLLTAASRLQQFTLQDLADHAGVSRELARSFVRRCADIERIDVQPQASRGRPKNLWRLRPERMLPVAAQVAEVARLLGLVPEPASEGPSSLELLESILKDLDGRKFVDPDIDRLLHRAGMYLESAEMEARDRAGPPSATDVLDEQTLEQARQRLTCWRAVRHNLPAWMVVLSPSAQHRAGFKRCLVDWTAPMTTPALGAEEARSRLFEHGALGILEIALGMTGREQTEDYAIDAALVMLHHKSGWDPGMQSALACHIAERLATASVIDNPFMVTALAATAAAFDIDEAAEPLFHTLLSRRLMAGLPDDWRTICLQSLARLARPVASRMSAVAASACQFLLARATDPGDYAVLAPPALAAPHCGGGALLYGIGRNVFAGIHSQPTARALDGGAVSRNVGLVLAAGRFAILQESVDSLVRRDDNHGRLLMQNLHAPRYLALDPIDSDDSRYVVRTSPKITCCLDMADPLKVPVSVNEETAKWVVNNLVSSHVWSPDWQGGAFTRGIEQRAQSAIRTAA
jgi:hypothetical protein